MCKKRKEIQIHRLDRIGKSDDGETEKEIKNFWAL